MVEIVNKIFKIIYLLLVVFVILAIIFSRLDSNLLFFFGGLGNLFGQGSIVIYILTLLPGIEERLTSKKKFFSIIRIYRRQLGIIMYLFALMHFIFIKVIFAKNFGNLLAQNIFEGMGSFAVFIFLLLFITSNNLSVSRLRLYWYRIQRLTYIGMFFIFFHVALLGFSIWTVLMGLIIILEILSFVAVYIKTGSLMVRNRVK